MTRLRTQLALVTILATIISTLATIISTRASIAQEVEAPTLRTQQNGADIVLIGGKILTVDAENRIADSIAIGKGRTLAVGTQREIRELITDSTEIIQLNGKTVIPGLIAAHCHAVGVARNALGQPHEELLTIAAVQEWIRRRAKEVAPGEWIRVPRADITRLKERRYPTSAELDAATSAHPVIFTAARKSAFNSLGWKTIGVQDAQSTVPGGKIVHDAQGNVALLSGANAHMREFMPRATHSTEAVLASLQKVHQHYNAVGITSIFERAGGIDDFLLYRKLRDDGKLTVRMTQTFRSGFRSAKDVRAFAQ